MEGAEFIKSGKLGSFSEQQLVDCAYGAEFSCYGCKGGNPKKAMSYYKTSHVELTNHYEYISGSDPLTHACAFDESKASELNVKRTYVVTKDSVVAMKVALTQQPLSVEIEADNAVF